MFPDNYFGREFRYFNWEITVVALPPVASTVFLIFYSKRYSMLCTRQCVLHGPWAMLFNLPPPLIFKNIQNYKDFDDKTAKFHWKLWFWTLRITDNKRVIRALTLNSPTFSLLGSLAGLWTRLVLHLIWGQRTALLCTMGQHTALLCTMVFFMSSPGYHSRGSIIHSVQGHHHYYASALWP